MLEARNIFIGDRVRAGRAGLTAVVFGKVSQKPGVCELYELVDSLIGLPGMFGDLFYKRSYRSLLESDNSSYRVLRQATSLSTAFLLHAPDLSAEPNFG